MSTLALILSLTAVAVSTQSAFRLARMLKKLRNDLFDIIGEQEET